MNTEGRLTRSKARVLATPLAPPLDTEPRRRTNRDVAKGAAEDMPRMALFDQTNAQTLGQAEKEPTKATPAPAPDSKPEPVACGGESQKEVPYEDNIVKQLLSEYEDSLQNETPLSAAPGQAPSAPAPEVTVPAAAADQAAFQEEERRVEEEMLITPHRQEATAAAPVKEPTPLAVPDSTSPEQQQQQQVEAQDGVSAEEALQMATAALEVAKAAQQISAAGAEHAEEPAAALVVVAKPCSLPAKDTAEAANKEGAHGTPAGVVQRWSMDGTPDVKPVTELTVQPAPVPACGARVKSEIKPTKSFDDRSLRQIKHALKAAGAPKPAGIPASSADSGCRAMSESTTAGGVVCGGTAAATEEASSDLCAALDALRIAPARAGKLPLRGLPLPEGQHIRFDDEAGAHENSPSTERVLLRGVLPPTGSHLRFN